MRIEKRMPSFNSVSAGNTASISLPIGRRYHMLYLFYSGITLAQMTEIRIKANGKVFQKFSATERDIMNQHKKLEPANGILRIPFDRVGLKRRDQEELTAVNTAVPDVRGNAINSFTLEIDIAEGVTAPSLKIEASQSAAIPGGPGLMMNIRRESRSINGAGELEVSDYLYGTPVSQSFDCMYAIPSAGSISKIRMERNLETFWERSAELNEMVQFDGVRQPISPWFSVDGLELGYGGNAFDLRNLNDFRVIYNCSEAMTVKSVFEYIGVLGN
ncbi:major capsid protein P2 [Agarilytica rhodophyticola]|uniref:major capsid protein P2 n=1 Tax=Agarilytica rhodophyticola TaxID=1737490 RepID=UPI000B342C0F|nr:major capsid protein P2 [Agarilytica rhodophyticola]